MNGTTHLEDHILISLFSSAKEDDPVPKIVYAYYEQTFTPLFQKVYGDLDFGTLQDLFKQAFLEFWDQTSNGPITAPLDSRLTYYFLRILKKEMVAAQILTQEDDLVEAFKKKIPKYLEGDILLSLIAAEYEPAEREIYTVLRPPMVNILKKKYGFFDLDPEDFCNEAIATGIKNIRKGNLEPPLRANLLTNFTRIGRNQLLNLGNKLKKLQVIFVENLQKTEYSLQKTIEEEEKDYIETLSEKYDLVRKIDPKDAKELVEIVLDKVKYPYNRYLKMYFLEEMSYEEIMETLDKEGKSMTYGAMRKAIYDGVEKARKVLNLK